MLYIDIYMYACIIYGIYIDIYRYVYMRCALAFNVSGSMFFKTRSKKMYILYLKYGAYCAVLHEVKMCNGSYFIGIGNGVRHVYCKVNYDVNLLLQMKSDFNF